MVYADLIVSCFSFYATSMLRYGLLRLSQLALNFWYKRFAHYCRYQFDAIKCSQYVIIGTVRMGIQRRKGTLLLLWGVSLTLSISNLLMTLSTLSVWSSFRFWKRTTKASCLRFTISCGMSLWFLCLECFAVLSPENSFGQLATGLQRVLYIYILVFPMSVYEARWLCLSIPT